MNIIGFFLLSCVCVYSKGFTFRNFHNQIWKRFTIKLDSTCKRMFAPIQRVFIEENGSKDELMDDGEVPWDNINIKHSNSTKKEKPLFDERWLSMNQLFLSLVGDSMETPLPFSELTDPRQLSFLFV